MTLESYLQRLSGRRVAVLGVGISNRPLLRLLADSGAVISAHDRSDRAKLGEFAHELDALGIRLVTGGGYLDNLGADVIFRTPGMRPDVPQLIAAVSQGAQLTSEMEAFFQVCPCPIIGVTGSDGKTTTATLLYEILKRAGHTCHLGGNIGRPLLSDAGNMGVDDRVIVELSSFQLMTMGQSPGVAVVTNLTPNHLDIHRDMAEYIAAKRHIFAHQNPGDTVVLNYDNDITRGFADSAPGDVVFFSKTPLESGVFLEDNAIWRRAEGVCERILDIGDIYIPGMHNVENYMAAIAAVRGLADADAVLRTAREFEGVAHRTEFVREVGGVRFYNNSIATSPTSVIAGLHTFPQKMIIIAGGSDKGLSFDPLAPEIIAHVKKLVLCGATADKIRTAVESRPDFDPSALPIVTVKTLATAVDAAYDGAVRGDIVMLAPACASFDMFRNFEERGEWFRECVLGL